MNISNLIQSSKKFHIEDDLQSADDLLIPLEKTEADSPFVQLEIGLTLDAIMQYLTTRGHCRLDYLLNNAVQHYYV